MMLISCVLSAAVAFVLEPVTPVTPVALAPTAPRVAVQEAAADPFPTPSEGLTIPTARESGPSLITLLEDFSRVTGQHLHISENARSQLRERPIGLLRPVEVPPAEVYSFVEALLWQSGFVLLDGRETWPPMLAVRSIYGDNETGGTDGILTSCVTVSRSALPAYRRHPALMIQTVVEVPGASHLNLSAVLNVIGRGQVMRYATVGDHVILRGPGRLVAHNAEVLEALKPKRKDDGQAKAETENEGR